MPCPTCRPTHLWENDMAYTNPHKVYVRVRAEFDKDGFVHPRAIIWKDGQVYDIDRVLDVRFLHSSKAGGMGDRFTIRVCGQERYLFYERISEMEGNHIGRWFIER